MNRAIKFRLLALFAACWAGTAVGQELVINHLPSLYSDKKAYQVGDIVTILLMEYTSGSNAATNNANFEHQFEFQAGGSGKLDFIPGLGLTNNITNDQKSEGGTTREGSLKGKMSARVIEMLPNGLLKLEVQRVLVVNGEQQLTILSGYVRPKDIMADNTVYSYLVADASITYRGKGMVDQATRPGIIARFLAWLF